VTLFVGQVGDLRRQRASQAAGFAAVSIAAAVLIGWWAGLPLLSSWGPGLPAMRPSGALVLAALGLALVQPGKDSRVAFAVGLAVIAVAALGLSLVARFSQIEGVKVPEFDRCIWGCEVQIGLCVAGIAVVLPSVDFLDEGLFVGNAAVEALGR
jgi:hypothetical protein